jgi:hypothetical protein
MITNLGSSFSRGAFSQTDATYTQVFTPDQPLIGMMGYSSTVLKALGFYTFMCANGVPSNNTNTANSTNTTKNVSLDINVVS